MKTVEYKTIKGFLREVRIKTEEVVKIDAVWLDAEFIELLLHIDEVWKTPRRLLKHLDIDKTQAEVLTFLRFLLDKGLVERRKVNNKHTEYKRAYTNPKHYFGDV
jgi:predicted transcriptional regulator